MQPYYHYTLPTSLPEHRITCQLKGKKAPCDYSIEEFEKLFDICYTHQLIFKDQKTFRTTIRLCKRMLKTPFFKKRLKWLGAYYKQSLEMVSLAPILIKWIDEKIAYGTFAIASIKKHDYIGEYTGLLHKRSYRLSKMPISDYCFSYLTSFVSLCKLSIDSQTYGNETRFINHSDFPNCESASLWYNGIFRVIFFATRDIPKGKQITYDYGEPYWRFRNKRFNV